jgi:hypothetical protein
MQSQNDEIGLQGQDRQNRAVRLRQPKDSLNLTAKMGQTEGL